MHAQTIPHIRRSAIHEMTRLCQEKGLRFFMTDHFIKRINVRAPDQAGAFIAFIRAVKVVLAKDRPGIRYSIWINGHVFLLIINRNQAQPMLSCMTYVYNTEIQHFSEAESHLTFKNGATA